MEKNEHQEDMAQLDALRPHIARMTKLLGRAEDSEMALGSDAMVTALEGCALLKVLGKGSGLAVNAAGQRSPL